MKALWACLLIGGMPLLLIFGGSLGTQPARAFEPSHDYWFRETFSVSAVALPAGVSIRTTDPAASPRGAIILENQTNTPVYVLSLNYKDVLVMVTPDPNWKNRVNGAHEVASYYATPTRAANLNMEALTDLDKNLVDQNVLSLEPPPADVSIPATQSSELLLVYGEQVLEVPFTVSYALNTQYNNGSQANNAMMMTAQAASTPSPTATVEATSAPEQPGVNGGYVIGLAGVAVLLATGWLVWRGLSRR